MWKPAKYLMALVLVITLFASSSGIALADDGQNSGGGQNGFWEMIAKAFNTTAEHAKNVFMRARDTNPPPPTGDNVTAKPTPTGENREEMTLEQIDKLVADGKLTAEQATEYKAWLANRPDGPFVDKNRMNNLLDDGTITQEQYDSWKAWHETKPDVELPKPQGQGNNDNKPNGQGNVDNRPNGQDNGNNKPNGQQGNRPPPASDNTTPNQPPTGGNQKPPPPPGGPGGNRR